MCEKHRLEILKARHGRPSLTKEEFLSRFPELSHWVAPLKIPESKPERSKKTPEIDAKIKELVARLKSGDMSAKEELARLNDSWKKS